MTLGISLLFAMIAFGQIGGGVGSAFTSRPDGTFTGSATFSGPFHMPVVTGAPYSGEQVSEQVQTLADGTHITRTNTGMKTVRDSQGRVRTERTMGPHTDIAGANYPAVIQVNDPVAGYQYTWDTINQVVHRQALPAAPKPFGVAMPSQTAARSAAGSGVMGDAIGGIGGSGRVSGLAPQQAVEQGPQTTSESLGTQTIDGVVTQGTRRTTVYPPGWQGSDGPITVVSEQWYSQDLKLMILSTSKDPRSGVNTTKFANFTTGEPDASLFVTPAGYQTVDETGSFTIRWGGN